jgi:hypothetical protein
MQYIKKFFRPPAAVGKKIKKQKIASGELSLCFRLLEAGGAPFLATLSTEL